MFLLIQSSQKTKKKLKFDVIGYRVTMKIQTSNIDLNSKSISLDLQRKLEFVQTKKIQNNSPKMVVDVDYIYESSSNQKSKLSSISKFDNSDKLPEIEDSLTPKEQVAKFLLEYIFGVKIQVNFYKIFEKEKQKELINNQSKNQNFEIEKIEFNERYEAESVNFSAKGNIKTNEGLSIEFSLNLELNREFYSTNIKTESNKKDPLVFNFSSSGLELSDGKFQFDINADGTNDSIHFPKPGNGFLVIDFNQNNRVDNGRELVGAISGNAISDLKNYDTDRNDWIDEQDDIYDKLKIWEKTLSGNDLISSLKDKDIGAIYLNLAKTPFQIKDEDITKGDITDTGIYAKENGLVRPFHKINLNL